MPVRRKLAVAVVVWPESVDLLSLGRSHSTRKEGSKAGKGRLRQRRAGGLAGTRTQEEGRGEPQMGSAVLGRSGGSLPSAFSVHVRGRLSRRVPTYYLPTFPPFPQEQRPRTKSSGMGGEEGGAKTRSAPRRLSLAQRSSLALNEVALTRLSSFIRRRAGQGPRKTFHYAEKCQPTRTFVIRCQ